MKNIFKKENLSKFIFILTIILVIFINKVLFDSAYEKIVPASEMQYENLSSLPALIVPLVILVAFLPLFVAQLISLIDAIKGQLGLKIARLVLLILSINIHCWSTFEELGYLGDHYAYVFPLYLILALTLVVLSILDIKWFNDAKKKLTINSKKGTK